MCSSDLALVCERGGAQRHQRVRSGCGSGDEIAVKAAIAARNRPGAAAAFDAVSDAPCHRYHLEVHDMTRQNLLSDAWDGDNHEEGTRHRVFWRPDYARMGATLYELAPGAPGMRMHMHFGAEEMLQREIGRAHV